MGPGTDLQDENEVARYRPNGVGPFIGVTSLRLVEPKPGSTFDPGLYVVIGEIEKTRKYILLDLKTGTIVPGYHMSSSFVRAKLPARMQDLYQ